MAKPKITIDIDEVMQDDELEARQSAAQQSKNKLMRRKKRIKILIVLIIISIFSVYMFSDYSNIRIIDINGNIIHTKEQLMKMAKIDYSMKSILAPGFLIKKRLEDERLREKFYWELYFLVDKDDNLTILGEYYTLIYTHHYLKALKLFLSFSDTLRDKNKVFFKNEKAMEYLEHFRNFVKKENTKVKKIK